MSRDGLELQGIEAKDVKVVVVFNPKEFERLIAKYLGLGYEPLYFNVTTLKDELTYQAIMVKN